MKTSAAKLATNARWKERNIERVRAWNKDYNEKNPDRVKEWSRSSNAKWYRKVRSTPEGHIRLLLAHRKTVARKQGIAFDIELADLLPAPDRCPIFGTLLAYGTRVRGQQQDSPSIDRIDPAQGYIKGNVWVISNRANTIKNDATLDELKTVVAALERAQLANTSMATIIP